MTGPGESSAPMIRALVVLTHPVQYFSPLFDKVTANGRVDLSVVYGNDAGVRLVEDEGLGTLRWDIPLVEGHPHTFLSIGEARLGWVSAYGAHRLLRAVRSADVVVVHGHATPLAAVAVASAWVTRTAYLLRSDTTVLTPRRATDPRRIWAELVSRRAWGALTSGTWNSEVHRLRGVSRLLPVPFTVDVERFSGAAHIDPRSTRREFGLPEEGPMVMFVGKFLEHKRPGDVVELMRHLPANVHAAMVGEGPLRTEFEASAGDRVHFLGFRNQSVLPRLMACATVLVLPSSHEQWGLVVNEGLAAGLVPVVSDAVGCAPDLVEGVGQVYPVGDIPALAEAVRAALKTAGSAQHGENVEAFRRHYSIDAAAKAFEDAVARAARDQGPHHE